MEMILIIITLSALTLAALVTARTVFVRMRRRLELAEATHTQAMKALETEHEERLTRLQRDAEQQRRYAHHKLVLEVLPVIDALNEASKFIAPADASPLSELQTTPASLPNAEPAIQHGVQLARKQLLQALERHGIEYIAPDPGGSFDPICHEAVHMVEDDTLQPGQIARCLRAGFRQDDRVLRSAMVEVVARSQAQSPDEPLESPSEEASAIPLPAAEPVEPAEPAEPEPVNDTSTADETSDGPPTPRNVNDAER